MSGPLNGDGGWEGEGATGGALNLCATLVRGLPREAWWAAALVATVHMLPVWLAQWSTPDGWTFTGITTVSPDYMQYRVWMRQSVEEGIVVRDLLTGEPTRAFLPVVLYWVVGWIAALTGITPEFVYQYLGCLLAAALALVLYGTIRQFMPTASVGARRTVFWITLLGGGLGGYLKLLNDIPFLYRIDTVRRLFVDPTLVVPIFEDYRQHYIVTTLFDTHFLLIWLLALLSILAFFAGVTRGKPAWALVIAALSAATALVHVYTGITLSAVVLCVALLYMAKGLWERRMTLHTVSAIGSVGIVTLWMLVLQRRSGIPMPDWQEPVIAVTTIVLAYPLQLALVGWGLHRLWHRSDQRDLFLLGWALGCLTLTLASPFYPYPSRGTLTLIIPLTVLAGLAYVRGVGDISRRALIVAALLTASTPVWRARMILVQGAFREESIAHQFMSAGHVQAAAALAEASSSDDLLLTTPRDALWLTPHHKGRNFAAHFFLTVDYDTKVEQVEAFLNMGPSEASRFLEQQGVDFFWVDVDATPARLRGADGVIPVVETEVGTLFRFDLVRARSSARAHSGVQRSPSAGED